MRGTALSMIRAGAYALPETSLTRRPAPPGVISRQGSMLFDHQLITAFAGADGEQVPAQQHRAGKGHRTEHHQRNPVHEQHDVGPFLLVVLDDGELVHDQKFIVIRPAEVDQADPFAPFLTVLLGADGHAFGQKSVKGFVVGEQVRRVRPLHLAQRFVQ